MMTITIAPETEARIRCKSEGLGMTQTQQEIALHLPKSDVVNPEAIRKWRDFKEAVMKHIRDRVKLHE